MRSKARDAMPDLLPVTPLWRQASLGTVAAWAFIAAASPIQTVPAAAAEPTTLLLFDSSGSMWGKLDGANATKFQMTRDALATALGDTGLNTALGLITFGRSCSGVRVTVPPAMATQQTVLDRLGALNPSSKGPITGALEKASEIIGPTDAANLVVVHDGDDNCRRDPCAEARRIAAFNPRIKIHLVSLGLETDAVAGTQCMAAATGGKVFSVTTGADIDTAMRDLIATLRQQSGPAPIAALTPPVSTEAATEPGVFINATLADGSVSINAPFTWTLAPATTVASADPKDGASAVAGAGVTTVGPVLQRPTLPGSYTVTANAGLVAQSITVEVAASAVATATVALNAGQLEFNVGGPEARGFLAVKQFPNSLDKDRRADAIAPPPTTVWLGRGSADALIVPPGRYRISYSDGLVDRHVNAEVAAGRTVSLDLAPNAGTLTVKAVTPSGAKLADAVTIVTRDDPAVPSGRREVVRSTAQSPTFTLRAGTYIVRVAAAGAEADRRIVVNSGAQVDEIFTLPIGTLTLRTNLVGAAEEARGTLSYRVMQQRNGAMSEFARSSDRQPVFELPAGRYDVIAELGAGNVTATDTVTITADSQTQATLTLDAGVVTLTRPGGQRFGNDAIWEILDGTGRLIWQTNQRTPTALLAPGRYTIRLDQNTQPTSEVLELASGERRTIELSR